MNDICFYEYSVDGFSPKVITFSPENSSSLLLKSEILTILSVFTALSKILCSPGLYEISAFSLDPSCKTALKYFTLLGEHLILDTFKT